MLVDPYKYPGLFQDKTACYGPWEVDPETIDVIFNLFRENRRLHDATIRIPFINTRSGTPGTVSFSYNPDTLYVSPVTQEVS